MSCDHCPCPAACLRWPAFCTWASESPADPVKLQHICARSAGPAAPVAATPGMPVTESLALTRAMGSCPYRATGPGCGCGGARCALRGGRTVSHVDCFACLRRYPE